MVQSGETVTLSDVAAAAGVSIATASRVLNGSTRTVQAGLSRRVHEAADRLQYSPNAPAQAMVRGLSSVIGLLVHDIADPYFSSIASGVSSAADDSGLIVMLGSTRGDAEYELRYLRTLRAQRGRGVILVGSRTDDKQHFDRLAQEVSAFQRSGGRVVAVSQAGLPADTIAVQNRDGATRLAGELAALGYRRFGVLAGPPGLLTARDRHRGFRRGIAAAGCEPPAVIHGDFTRDGGYGAMHHLLDTIPDLDCVFAVNDVMAVGAVAACRSRGLRLPGDLALAGFDDIAPLRDVTPSLTTVRLPLTDIGTQAMHLIDSPPSPRARRRRIRGTVVLRESTPPAR